MWRTWPACLRTIEALALAIEAKDDTTHSHLRRVEVYAVEIGKDLGLSDSELQALRAAALLHDIGKDWLYRSTSSPKPGTSECCGIRKDEIHPVVGQEFWRKWNFPIRWLRLCAPIMKNGTAAVTPRDWQGKTSRSGRGFWLPWTVWTRSPRTVSIAGALPLDKAMAHVVAEAGKSFDPRVVEILVRRFVDLVRLVNGLTTKTPRLWKNIKIERGLYPTTGFENCEKSDGQSGGGKGDFQLDRRREQGRRPCSN